MRTCRTKGTLYLLILFSFLTWVGAVPVSRAQSREMSVLEKVAVYPTLIVYNGKIATMDEDLSFHQAMALRGDHIWRLGADQEIKGLAGSETQLIDLKGRTVTPGLIDVHTHPQMWGLWHFGGEIDPQLEPVYVDGETPEEVVANFTPAVKARIGEKGVGKWVFALVPHRMQDKLVTYPISYDYKPRPVTGLIHARYDGRNRAQHTY